MTDQIPYAEKDYLDVGSPESIGRVLRVTHSDASSVGDITGLIPPFYTEKLLKKGVAMNATAFGGWQLELDR